MSDLRALAISVCAAALIAAYTIVFWRWPVALGLGTGVFLGGLALMTSVSLGPDPADADAAWRAEAPDLVVGASHPLERSPSARRPRAGSGRPAAPAGTSPGAPPGSRGVSSDVPGPPRSSAPTPRG